MLHSHTTHTTISPLHTRTGMTKDLVFRGDDVLHMHTSLCASWQRDYAIMDRFTKGFVFVPRTPTIVCKLFRVNHEPADRSPTHRLVHVSHTERPALCCLREVGKGEEITFDYFGIEDEVPVSLSPPDDSQASASVSLSSLSGEPTFTLTGNGLRTESRLNKLLQDKFMRLEDTDVCPTLAFNTIA